MCYAVTDTKIIALKGLINFVLWYNNKYINIKYNIEDNGSSLNIGDNPWTEVPDFPGPILRVFSGFWVPLVSIIDKGMGVHW